MALVVHVTFVKKNRMQVKIAFLQENKLNLEIRIGLCYMPLS